MRSSYEMMIEPSKEQDLLGVVLVGGRSRRMGRDKALMPWQGRTLLNRAVGVLQSCFERVAVIGPARIVATVVISLSASQRRA